MKPFGIEVGVLNYKNRRPNDVLVFKRLEEQSTNKYRQGGQIINEDALREALKSGDIKGFGSDVRFQYPT